MPKLMPKKIQIMLNLDQTTHTKAKPKPTYVSISLCITIVQGAAKLPPPYKNLIITSAEEGGYVFGSVCLSVCLPSDYSQTCERILTKFLGGVGHGSRTK